jgi:xylulokinase
VGGLDHHMAAIGAGIGTAASVSVSFGTSLVCFCLLDRYESRTGCCLGPSTDRQGFYRISFSSPGASALDEYKDRFTHDMTFETLFCAAQGIEPGADGLTAEISDGALRFSGAKETHGHGHYVRAIMERIGRNTARLLDDLSMDKAFPAHPGILAVGGGARSDLWMQVVADVSNRDVVRARPADSASKGAAMLCAIAMGWYRDVRACAAEWCYKIPVVSISSPRSVRSWVYDDAEAGRVLRPISTKRGRAGLQREAWRQGKKNE